MKTVPFRKTLISAEQSVRVETWKMSGRVSKTRGMRGWSVSKTTLHGGRQEGVDLIEIDNGRIKLTVIPTRGMGVLKVESDDLRLGWDSPVREVVHPHFVNLQGRNGLGWLDGFNEWLVRCGLGWCGAPGRDEVTGSDLTLHGNIANIPASEVEVVIDKEVPFGIHLRGRVDERSMFGLQLEMWTEISIEPGATTFRVEDRIRNRGGCPSEFQLLYHVNYGTPLLGEGSRFVGAVKTVTPATPHAAKASAQWDVYGPPTPGLAEHVYFMEPYADDSKRTMVMLQNAAADRAVSMRFALDQLPCFSLWKNTGALEDGYVTGLEPATGFPRPRPLERKAGRVPTLAPGEERSFGIEFGIHSNSAEVERAAGEIARIIGGRRTTVGT